MDTKLRMPNPDVPGSQIVDDSRRRGSVDYDFQPSAHRRETGETEETLESGFLCGTAYTESILSQNARPTVSIPVYTDRIRLPPTGEAGHRLPISGPCQDVR